MTAANGRGDRRRRMIQENSSLGEPVEATASAAPRERAANASRYALADPSVSFAVARRLPLRRRWLLAFTTLATAVGAAVIAGDLYRTEIATQLKQASLPLLDVTMPQSLAAWLVNSLLLLAAGLSVVVYAMRRRRTDDLDGRYRWWLMACLGAVGISIGWSTGVHQTAAMLVADAVGWSPIEGFWWITPLALLSLWAGFRLLMDVKESPLTTTIMGAGFLSLLTAILASYEALPAEAMQHKASVLFGGFFAAASFTVITLLAYARHIVLEADGVIAPPERSGGTASRRAEAREAKREAREAKRMVAQEKAEARAQEKEHKRALAAQQKEEQAHQKEIDKARKQSELQAERDQKQAEQKAAAEQAKIEKQERLKAQQAARKAAAKPVTADTPEEEDSSPDVERSTSRRANRSQPASARNTAHSETVWTNGDDASHDDYEDESGGRRKLTKAERKRLRKQKERQNRAA